MRINFLVRDFLRNQPHYFYDPEDPIAVNVYNEKISDGNMLECMSTLHLKLSKLLELSISQNFSYFLV